MANNRPARRDGVEGRCSGFAARPGAESRREGRLSPESRREGWLAVMIPKPSGIILINVGSGDSKNGNICTRRKSMHLKADFSYRETKILYREKKYLFKRGFAVPGEILINFIWTRKNFRRKVKDHLYVKISNTCTGRKSGYLEADFSYWDNCWHFPYREKVPSMPPARIASWSAEDFCSKSLSLVSCFFSIFFSHEVALALFVDMSDLLPTKTEKKNVFNFILEIYQH